MNAYKENKYVPPLKISKYAGLVSNLNSYIIAAATDWQGYQKKKKKKKNWQNTI